MDMYRLVVISVKEEPESEQDKDSRHFFIFFVMQI